MGDGAVAAGLLGAVKGLVGPLEEVRAVFGVAREHRYTGADRRRQLVAVDGEGSAERLHELRGDPARARWRLQVGQHDRDLVAADSGRGVGPPEQAEDPVRRRRQQPVAGRVPVPVVHLLEAVEIDDDDADRAAGPTALVEGLAEAFLVHDPGGQPCQGVVVGEAQQLLLVSAPFAHVMEQEHRSCDLIARAPDRRRAQLERRLGAVAPGEREDRAPLQLLTAGEHAVDRFGGRPVVASHRRAHDVGQLVIDGLCLRPPDQTLGGGIHEPHPAGAIGCDHAVGDARQRGVEPLAAVPQRQIGAVPGERHLDGDSQVALVEGLAHEAVGTRGAHLMHGVVIGERGEEDDREVVRGADRPGGRNAVHLAPQLDVHQDEIGGRLEREVDRVLSRRHRCDDLVAPARQQGLEVQRDDALVLDDRDAGGRARSPGRPLGAELPISA